jgi:hypothetical protein
MLLATIGLASLHWVITSEILEQKVYAKVYKNLPYLTFQIRAVVQAVGLHGCMLIFAATCFGGAIFVLFVLSDTKGKSIEDIVDDLEGRK